MDEKKSKPLDKKPRNLGLSFAGEGAADDYVAPLLTLIAKLEFESGLLKTVFTRMVLETSAGNRSAIKHYGVTGRVPGIPTLHALLAAYPDDPRVKDAVVKYIKDWRKPGSLRPGQ